MTRIYLDNAATTAVAPDVAAVVQECMCDEFGNPSSAHHMGISAEKRIKTAYAQLATAIGDPEQNLGRIYWTSGGTESDGLGVIGAARARHKSGSHILYSAIEHPAVRESVKMLARDGFEPEIIPVTRAGVVDIDQALSMVRDDTIVIALMLVNNEIGTIQPVAELAHAIATSGRDIHLHCDAVQALGKIPVDIDALGATSVAFAGHKLHAPKGIGALWLKRGARLAPLWGGGGQQDGMRPGTLAVPGIASLGAAVELSQRDLKARIDRWRGFADRLVAAAHASGVPVRINGEGAPRAAHVLSLAFSNIPAEPLLHVLESRGVLVSAGSACSERQRKPSPVLTAIGSDPNDGTIRLSFGRMTTEQDIDQAAGILIDAVRDL